MDPRGDRPVRDQAELCADPRIPVRRRATGRAGRDQGPGLRTPLNIDPDARISESEEDALRQVLQRLTRHRLADQRLRRRQAGQTRGRGRGERRWKAWTYLVGRAPAGRAARRVGLTRRGAAGEGEAPERWSRTGCANGWGCPTRFTDAQIEVVGRLPVRRRFRRVAAALSAEQREKQHVIRCDRDTEGRSQGKSATCSANSRPLGTRRSRRRKDRRADHRAAHGAHLTSRTR